MKGRGRDPRSQSNNRIRAPKVRVVDSTGKNLGVMPTWQAENLAKDQGLDLVVISEGNENQLTVCKIMDRGKFLYDEKKKGKKEKNAQKEANGKVKEVKFRSGTDTGDVNHKLAQIREFLAEGNKVKLSLQYRGRENAHKEVGEDMIASVLAQLEGECSVEQAPRTDGRVHSCMIGPPRKKSGGGDKTSIKITTGGDGAKPPAGSIQIAINKA